jgi:molecular chaperone DnaJ
VSRDATAEDIKRAYKLLALRYHPDKSGGDAAAVEAFQRVRNAFGVLSDERKRRYYDETGSPFPSSAHRRAADRPGALQATRKR